MVRVLVSVEGQTEEAFVKEVLAPHLAKQGVLIEPRVLATKRVKHGPVFKGGIVSYHQIRDEIRRLFLDHHVVAVTTMYDLYGLPHDFPGYATRPITNPFEKVQHLEEALSRDIANPYFHPYLQLHEYETFLYVDPVVTAALFPETDHLRELQTIRDAFSSPEEINDGLQTAPSKRLLSIYPDYQKSFHGPLAALEMGLGLLRGECAHFRAWLEWLESLGKPV